MDFILAAVQAFQTEPKNPQAAKNLLAAVLAGTSTLDAKQVSTKFFSAASLRQFLAEIKTLIREDGHPLSAFPAGPLRAPSTATSAACFQFLKEQNLLNFYAVYCADAIQLNQETFATSIKPHLRFLNSQHNKKQDVSNWRSASQHFFHMPKKPDWEVKTSHAPVHVFHAQVQPLPKPDPAAFRSSQQHLDSDQEDGMRTPPQPIRKRAAFQSPQKPLSKPENPTQQPGFVRRALGGLGSGIGALFQAKKTDKDPAADTFQVQGPLEFSMGLSATSAADAEPEPIHRTCQGHTQSGKPCTRRVTSENPFCFQHHPISVQQIVQNITEPSEQVPAHLPETSSLSCHGITQVGAKCRRKPLQGNVFCSQHRHQEIHEQPEHLEVPMPLPETSSLSCYGQTQAGARCRRKPLQGNIFCSQHRHQEVQEQPEQQVHEPQELQELPRGLIYNDGGVKCGAQTQQGGRCSRAHTHGSFFCAQHAKMLA